MSGSDCLDHLNQMCFKRRLAGDNDGPSSEDHLVHRRHWEHGGSDGAQEDDPLSQCSGTAGCGRRATLEPSAGRTPAVQNDLPCV